MSEGKPTRAFDFLIFLLPRLINAYYDLQGYFLAIQNSLLFYDTPCLPPNFVQPLFFISPEQFSRRQEKLKTRFKQFFRGENKIYYGKCANSQLAG